MDKSRKGIKVSNITSSGDAKSFKILEALRYYNGYINIGLHLERLSKASKRFNFGYDKALLEEALNESEKLEGREDVLYKVRLKLSVKGEVAIEFIEVEDLDSIGYKLILSKERTCSCDKFLYYKTTKRALYDKEHERARNKGYYDILFFNEREELTEGAITNIYVKYGDGKLYTPRISSGLLNGTIRRVLLERGLVEEKEIYKDELKEGLKRGDKVYLSNSIIGFREGILEGRLEIE